MDFKIYVGGQRFSPSSHFHFYMNTNLVYSCYTKNTMNTSYYSELLRFVFSSENKNLFKNLL